MHWPNRDLPTADTTIQTLTDEYLASVVQVCQSTYENHARTCAYMVAHYGQYFPIGDVTPSKAGGFRVWLTTQISERTRRPLAFTTVAKHAERARGILQFAVDRGYLVDNPFSRIKIPKVSAAAIWNYVTMEQYERMILFAEQPGHRIMVSLARLAGLRRNEIERLRWQSVDMDERVIYIKPESSRITSKQHQRVVPIQPRLYEELERARLGAVDEMVFNYTGHNKHDLTVFRMAMDAGIPKYGKPLHTLRKSLATDWLAEHPPLDVAAWLGHGILVSVKHYHATLPKTLDAVRLARDSKEAKQREIDEVVKKYFQLVNEDVPDWDTVRKAEQERLRRLGNGESLEAIDGIRPE